MVVNKTLRAESKDKMEETKEEVKLDITEQPDLLKLYVNGPSAATATTAGMMIPAMR